MKRADKEKQLKDNMDRGIARSKEDHRKDTGKAMSKARQSEEKQEFNKAVKIADSKLSTAWNDDKPQSVPDGKRPMFGSYFGGVEFDKEGNIIR